MLNNKRLDQLAVAATERIKEKDYWQNKLVGFPGKTSFPMDFPRGHEVEKRREEVSFNFPSQLSSRLIELSNGSDVRLHMILVAGLMALLHWYLQGYSCDDTGIDPGDSGTDITVGSPILSPDVEADFINTVLVFRNQVRSGMTFKQLLLEVKETIIEATKNQNYPLEILAHQLNMSLSGEDKIPLVDIAIMMENIHDKKYISHLQLKMIFSFLRQGSSLQGRLEYDPLFYKESSIQRIIKQFLIFMQKISLDVSLELSHIEVIAPEEKRQLLFDFNNIDMSYPVDKTIHRLFEKQVGCTPDRTALVNARQSVAGQKEYPHLTYRELDEQSLYLAQVLRERGIGPGVTAGIMVERSMGMIIGILGILKTGGTYLPINSKNPVTRTQYMLADSGTRVLVTVSQLAKEVKTGAEMIFIDSFEFSHFSPSHLFNLSLSNPVDLAYIIYTSGSTGIPKGVPIAHANFSALVHWGYQFGIGPDERVIQDLSYYFDWSVWEIFITLTTGASLFMITGDIHLNPRAVVDFILHHNITVLHITPTQYQYLVNIGKKLETLRYLFIGAEKLNYDLVRRSIEAVNPGCRIFNMYGPTEATIISATLEIDREKVDGYQALTSVPIGKPAGNTVLLVLDRYLQMCPIEVTGELYIVGDGVAQGYLNRPELTAEKFHHDLWDYQDKRKNRKKIPGKKICFNRADMSYGSQIFKTGDLMRWLEDGNIEFLGRIDHQVKIRGNRIELGEIETQLLKYDGIRDTVVVTLTDEAGEQALCAYIVPSSNSALSLEQIRHYLQQHLPDYMVPSHLVILEQMPLTGNGKIDRKALPQPGSTAIKAYTAPGNELEAELVNIWADVLGVDRGQIGIDDHFFELGGHSLKVMELVGRMHEKFNVELDFKEVFHAFTIRELGAHIKEKEVKQYHMILPVEKREYYKVSSPQKGMFFLQRMNSLSIAYNSIAALTLAGVPAVGKLEQVFRQIIRRHESLRTSFHMIHEELVQVVHGEAIIDQWSLVIEEGNRVEIYGIDGIVSDFIRPFDLEEAPLLRVKLITLEDKKHMLLVDMHHIISDGASANILVRDFADLYKGDVLPEMCIQYKDFAEWQSCQSEREKIKQQEMFWLKEFAGEIPALNLPMDYPRPSIKSFEGRELHFELDRDQTRALKSLVLKTKVTLFMMLLSIYNILLSKLGNQEDIIVGTPVAGRKHLDLEPVMGMFVNTVGLRNFPRGEHTFTGFLGEVKNRAADAFTHQDYPYIELVEKVFKERDASGNPLFDVIFAFQGLSDFSIDARKITLKDLTITPYPYRGRTAKFDLMLAVIEDTETLHFYFEYCIQLFKADTVLRFVNYFREIICKVLASPGIKLSGIEIIPEEEKTRLLQEFNHTSSGYTANKTADELFEKQVECTPDHAALVGQIPGQEAAVGRNVSITYRELNEKSHGLACQLRIEGVETDTIVAVLMERSPEMIIGLLGILKAGAAYLPIDTEYPPERIDYMLADSNVKYLLKNSNIISELKNRQGLFVFNFEHLNFEFVSNFDIGISDLKVSNLAYIIYTSGSTGRPKGVGVTHQNLTSYLHAFFNEFNLDARDIVVQQASYSFDAFVEEMYPVLLRGGKLAIPSREVVRDIRWLCDFIQEHQVTFITCSPLMLNELNRQDSAALDSIRVFISGGDVLKGEYIGNLLKTGSVYNTYGPTEATVCATYYRCGTADGIDSVVPIGKPISNYRLYIRDKYNRLLPIGVPGEICIAGNGVTRGYLNNPELTAQKFDQDLWDDHDDHDKRKEVPGKRIYRSYRFHKSYITYKTGDLARWLADGNIQFLGRLDNQVKIRGFRIELGEIENQLLQLDEIKEAVVIPREDTPGNIFLWAYLVPRNNEPSLPGLREYLSRTLPQYMIPTHFLFLEKIPLTPGGKIDRGALPLSRLDKGKEYIAPRNKIEEKMAVIWAQVLGIEKDVISIDKSFFELGGHSLNIIVLAAKIHKEMNVKLSLAQLFETHTIIELARYIKESVKDEFTSIEPVEEKEYYPLSSPQKRLYIMQQMEINTLNYNMPQVVILEGKLEKKYLEEVFRKLIKRHESLRTSFMLPGSEPVQQVHRDVKFAIQYEDMAAAADKVKDSRIKGIIGNFIRPFDLAQAPLLRVGLIKTGEQEHIMAVDMHHIISDGVSMDILTKDFMALYNGNQLPLLRIHYKDWPGTREHSKTSETIKQQETYWLGQFAGEIPVLNLPLDYPRLAVPGFAGDRVKFSLNEEHTKTLIQLALNEGATLHMVLLAIYTILLSKISGQEDIIVGIPIMGRRHTDLEQIIGMFVNTMLLRNHPTGHKGFGEFLKEVKTRAMEAFENQDYQFEELINKLGVDWEGHLNPLFDAGFSLQNTDPATRTIYQQEITGLKLRSYELENNTTKCDLLMSGTEIDGKVNMILEYSTQLFKKERIERYIKYFKEIVEAVLKNKDIHLHDIKLSYNLYDQKINNPLETFEF